MLGRCACCECLRGLGAFFCNWSALVVVWSKRGTIPQSLLYKMRSCSSLPVGKVSSVGTMSHVLSSLSVPSCRVNCLWNGRYCNNTALYSCGCNALRQETDLRHVSEAPRKSELEKETHTTGWEDLEIALVTCLPCALDITRLDRKRHHTLEAISCAMVGWRTVLRCRRVSPWLYYGADCRARTDRKRRRR